MTMKLYVYRFLAASGLLAVASASMDDVVERNLQGPALCRCEASWEDFYYRRLEQQRDDVDAKEPSRQRSLYHHFDYTDAYLDNEGYYVIEGVKVLPREQCNAFNFFGRNLEEDSSTSFERDVINIASPASTSSSSAALSEADESSEQSSTTRDLTYYYGSKGKNASLGVQKCAISLFG